MSRANPGKQSGFMLIETLIAVTVFFVVYMQVVKFGVFKLNLDNAEVVGHRIAEYNAAVASYVNAEPGRLAQLMPPQAFPFGVQNGVGWLQAPPCAGATGAVAYLSCGFESFLPYQLGYATTLAPNGGFITATTNLGPAVTGIGVDRAQGGAIVRAASAYRASYTTNAETTSGFMRYDIDIPTGNLTAVVDTAALGDRWLRTDGSNQMTGNLNMGNNSLNNAATVTANTAVNTAAVNATGSVNAGGDLNAGRDVNVNAAGGGGNVQIMGTAINLAGSVQGSRYVFDGDVVGKPQCPPNAPAAGIFTSAGGFVTADGGEPVYGIKFNAIDTGPGWQIEIQARNSSLAWVPAGLYVKALVNLLCQ